MFLRHWILKGSPFHHEVLIIVSSKDFLWRKTSLTEECWAIGSSVHTSEVDKLFRSVLNIDLRCLCRSCLSFSLKKLVVKVYRIGFKALFIGRINMTIQEVTVPVNRQTQQQEVNDRFALRQYKNIKMCLLDGTVDGMETINICPSKPKRTLYGLSINLI